MVSFISLLLCCELTSAFIYESNPTVRSSFTDDDVTAADVIFQALTTSLSSGGAISFDGSQTNSKTISLERCSFIECSATGGSGLSSRTGGAIHDFCARLEMVQCCGLRCYASGNGNFIFLSTSPSPSTITLSTIKECAPASAAGLDSNNNLGAVYLTGDPGSEIANTNFTDCRAAKYGSVLYHASGSVTLDHLQISGNRGSTLLDFEASATLRDSNIVSNRMDESLSWLVAIGVFQASAADIGACSITGCIFRDNVFAMTQFYVLEGTPLTMTGCVFSVEPDGLPTGIPFLVDPNVAPLAFTAGNMEECPGLARSPGRSPVMSRSMSAGPTMEFTGRNLATSWNRVICRTIAFAFLFAPGHF
jgi:hypothetical protein